MNIKIKMGSKFNSIIAIIAMGITILSFQNCIAPSFNSVTVESLINCSDPSCEEYRNSTAYCEFNGTFVPHNHRFTAFLQSNGSCQSEVRSCSNGSLTGSYPFAFCDPALTEAGACLFGGRTIRSGQSVRAYLSGSGNCTSEMRVCNNGVLSGSYPYATCVAEGEAPCLFNGNIVRHGAVVRAFASSSVAHGTTCTEELRLCTNGSLSGRYEYPSCAVNVPRSCLINNTVVPHQGTITTYQTSTVPFGTTCRPQIRTCNDGSMSGTYQFSSCAVGAPAHCLFNSATVVHGQSVEAFKDPTVPYEQECQKQTRTCSNGSLSGSFASPSCVVSGPSSCVLDGRTFAHGSSMRAYTEPNEDGDCESAIRNCHNGTFNGSNNFKYVTCKGNSSGTGDGSGGSGSTGDGYACPSGQISVGSRCVAEFSSCSTSDFNHWKQLAQNGDERAKIAWTYCEFIGSYRSRSDFDGLTNLRRSSPSYFCSMTLTNFLLWDKCSSRAGDYQSPVCFDSAEQLVKSAFRMALKREPENNGNDDDYHWFYRTEFYRHVQAFKGKRASDTFGKSFLYMGDNMCNSNEFKNKHNKYMF